MLVELVDLLRPSLQQLLNDLCSVDRRKEVPPRILGDELDLLVRRRSRMLVRCSSSKAGSRSEASGRDRERVLWTVVLRIAREVDVAVAEEARKKGGEGRMSIGEQGGERSSSTHFFSLRSVFALTISTGSGYWKVLTMTTGQFMVTRS